MRTKVFAYRGIIGIESGKDYEGILHPAGNDSPLTVVKLDSVDFSPEAVELLKLIKRGERNSAILDILKFDDDEECFIFYGFKGALRPEGFESSNKYDPSLIITTVEMEPSEEFKTYVDDNYEDLIAS